MNTEMIVEGAVLGYVMRNKLDVDDTALDKAVYQVTRKVEDGWELSNGLIETYPLKIN